jgi:soluble lytic murein transglycosylase-like protein
MSKYAKISLVVPDMAESFAGYNLPHIKAANADLLREIDQKYGSLLRKWGGVFDIGKGLLAAFMATESGGRFYGVNMYQACGLMQITPNALWECVRKWRNEVDSPIPIEAERFLKQEIPFIFTSPNLIPSGVFRCAGLRNNACTLWEQNTTGERKVIIDKLVNNNEFNIMAGTLVLRWLLERFRSPIGALDLAQLNKAIVGYNAGAYLKVLGGKLPIDTTILAKSVSSEPRNYLRKMMGKHGFLELIYKDNVISPN